MKIKSSVLFDEVSEPAGGGGGVATLPAPAPGGPDADIFGGSSEPTTAPAVTPVTPPAAQTPAPVAPVKPAAAAPQTAMTPEQIADLGASAAARVLQAQRSQTPAAPAPQMSQEEFDRTFKVFKADAATFAAITGYAPEKPEQVTALNTALQGVARQALAMADALNDQKIAALRAEVLGEFAPVKTAHVAQFERQLRDDFFAAHADLKDFGPLVETVAANIKASGQKFDSKEALFKFAADKTRSLLPASVLQQPSGASAAVGTPPQQPTTQRRMTTVSTGGQVSAPTASAARPNDAQAIFG